MNNGQPQSMMPGEDIRQALAELQQLKNTVMALRRQLEESEASVDERVQRAVAESAAEIAQLKKTIAAQRAEQESGQLDNQQKLQNEL
ncbi:MAG: hypothetical protein KJO35_05910, partial [Gammaproteobacteria bacterium]|nr:hypothetical protein [Gammaproteobacteria bacterium]